MTRKTADGRGREPRQAAGSEVIQVRLTADQLDELRLLANYYEKSLGPLRVIVWLTAGREFRRKYRFVVEESRWIRRFVEEARAGMEEGDAAQDVRFTLRALIAFWGRIVASLQSRRSRRKLSDQAIERREQIGRVFCSALLPRWRRAPDLVENELLTRRPAEATLLRERLQDASGERQPAPPVLSP